ncbi:MAG: NDP-hexose 2,3-dehydratase family protein [Candidatus Omnitrophota bacterium]
MNSKQISELRQVLLAVLNKNREIKNKDIAIKVDFFISSLYPAGSLYTSGEIKTWFKKIRKNSKMKTKLIPVKEMKGWLQDQKTGNIIHESGKFFSVIGIETVSETREVKSWCQPIIKQPEIGILGILVKKINGVYHFLVQAKEEPGNINKVQLSTTVMATKSNYTRVHGGKAPLYLDYFLGGKNGKIIIKKLQSEEGARFYKKNNLNMVVEIASNCENKVPCEFKWVTLHQIKEMACFKNTVNAPLRSVISCLP